MDIAYDVLVKHNLFSEKRHNFGHQVMDIEDLVNLGNKHKYVSGEFA